jgi:hypothetical protein
MSSVLSVLRCVFIELPGNLCQMMLNSTKKWWYSHYH